MTRTPPFQVHVRRFGVWRTAVAALLLAAIAAQAAWVAARHDDTPGWLLALLSTLCVALIAAAAPQLRRHAVALHWDSRCWRLGAISASGHDLPPGNLTIALDLGCWMLLKFEPEGAAGHRRATWLPVQRRGLEGEWHALRCAVYCARPASGRDAGPNSSASPESQE